ncbi:MAG: hypothetical protein HQL98_10945 [Magnetococcales bacterium]|nr:hypothetical protein [Magnetococcales bacterium]
MKIGHALALFSQKANQKDQMHFLDARLRFFLKKREKSFFEKRVKGKTRKSKAQSQNPGGGIPQTLSFFLIVIASLAGF